MRGWMDQALESEPRFRDTHGQCSPGSRIAYRNRNASCIARQL